MDFSEAIKFDVLSCGVVHLLKQRSFWNKKWALDFKGVKINTMSIFYIYFAPCMGPVVFHKLTAGLRASTDFIKGPVYITMKKFENTALLLRTTRS